MLFTVHVRNYIIHRFVGVRMKYEEWSLHVKYISDEVARELPVEIVARLQAVQDGVDGVGRDRDFCVALLRDLNKPPIPRSVTTSFYKPLVELSKMVRHLRTLGTFLSVIVRLFPRLAMLLIHASVVNKVATIS